jgi:hypothetical protein
MYINIHMDRVSQYKGVQNEAISLFKKKNQDYGDSFANFGPVGVIVRMGDKINRLSSITKSSVSLVKTESIRDTLIDLHNYAAMAVMLMDEEKPTKEKTNKYDDEFIKNNIDKSTNNEEWGQFNNIEDASNNNL